MQPSYPYCKVCGHFLNKADFPEKIIGNNELPTDDEKLFETLLVYARENIRCPNCGSRKWIRKVYWKV